MGIAQQKKTSEKGIFLRESGSFVIDKVIRGVRIYENLGPVSLDFAKDVLAKRRTELKEGAYFPNMVKGSGSLTIRDALNLYWSEHLQYAKSAGDAKHLLTIVDAALGTMQARQVTKAHVERYARDRLRQRRKIRYKDKRGSWQVREGAPISKRTVRAELEILRAALNWAVDNNKLQNNPLPKFSQHGSTVLRLKKPDKIMLDEGTESGPDWQRLYNATSDDLKPIVLTLYETGMRPVEVFHMSWSWVNEIDRTISIPADQEKTETARRVPISDSLAALFQSLPKTGDLVFPSPITGQARQGIKKGFDAAVRRAGLSGRGITPYALRRTRLSVWDAIDHVGSMSAGGHTQVSTHVRHYVNVPRERLLKLVS